MKNFFYAVTALALVCSIPGFAKAGPKSFVGWDGVWETPENWNPPGKPANGDDVTLTASVWDLGGVARTVNTLATFNDETDPYFGGDSKPITLTVTSGATFSGNSFVGSSYTTTINGDVEFHNSSYINNSSYNTISGDVTFNDYSRSGGAITGNVELNDYSYINDSVSITGDVTLNGSSCIKNDSSINAGNVTFNETSYSGGSITGPVTFNGTSEARNGTITGTVQFFGFFSINGCDIHGTAELSGDSHIESGNFSNCEIKIKGTSTWYDTTTPHTLIIGGDHYWAGTGFKKVSGSDDSEITQYVFNDNSYNKGGTINGDAKFNTTWYSGDGSKPTGGTLIIAEANSWSGSVTATLPVVTMRLLPAMSLAALHSITALSMQTPHSPRIPSTIPPSTEHRHLPGIHTTTSVLLTEVLSLTPFTRSTARSTRV